MKKINLNTYLASCIIVFIPLIFCPATDERRALSLRLFTAT